MVRFHVDEVETNHIVGTILHIARHLDTGHEWPLWMVDFQGQLVELTMVPGDMVIFESSKVIHGRPLALHGDYYINTFFYYKPKNYINNFTHKETENTVKDTGVPNSDKNEL